MAAHHTATFAEHIHELRVRLMWSLLFVAAGAGAGYALHDKIIHILQNPLNESLYYTTPTGAFSFVIKVCVVFGFVFALPVVVYQVFAFFGPLLPKKSKRSIVWYVLWSVLLAAAGILFAYTVSLPAALHFLVNFGNEGGNIQALITADEYFNFVLAYVAGFAALFQLPLIISFINKVTPLKPSQLIGGTRYVILGSFIASAIITPTPDPLNQALMAGPIILLYFVSVLVIATANAAKRRKKPKASVPEMVLDGIEELLEEGRAQEPKVQATAPSPVPAPVRPAPVPVMSSATTSARQPIRRQRLVNDMVVSPGRARVNLAAPRQSRTIQRAVAVEAPIARRSPSMRMGVISDFFPASK